MSTLNGPDLFLVERDNTQYKVSANKLMSTIKDTDLMIVARGNDQYKVTCGDVKGQLGGPSKFTVEYVIIGGGGLSLPAALPTVTQMSVVLVERAGGYLSSVSGEKSGGGLNAQPSIELTTQNSYAVTIGAATMTQ